MCRTVLGIADRVQALKQRARSEGQANLLQVKMELQADCFAGVWASLNHQMKNRLQPGDIESGLNAAAAIGDDRLQKQTQGYAVPESFTHGSSAQRVRWFKRGWTPARRRRATPSTRQSMSGLYAAAPHVPLRVPGAQAASARAGGRTRTAACRCRPWRSTRGAPSAHIGADAVGIGLGGERARQQPVGAAVRCAAARCAAPA